MLFRSRGDAKAVIDYAVHLIITDPTEQVLGQELPALIRAGYTSFKVYMTYEGTKLDDYQMLEVLSTARREGALTMIHAENWYMIRWLAQRLIDGGNRAPVYHGVSHAEVAEGEATHRAIALGRLLGRPDAADDLADALEDRRGREERHAEQHDEGGEAAEAAQPSREADHRARQRRSRQLDQRIAADIVATD